MHHLTLIALLAFRVFLPGATGPPPPAPPPAVFVLAGQSNMAPIGASARPAVPEDDRIAVYPGTFVLERRGQFTLASDGPGLALLRGVARSGRAVGAVGCGVGGTGIREWQRGEAPYDACVTRLRALGLRVAGLAFYQGEADTWSDGREPRTLSDGVTLRAPHTWGTDFAAFVASFREDLGQPDLPVAFVRIAHSDRAGRDNWGTVQAAQDAVRLPGVVLVPSEPATLVDGLHLDAASHDRVGERLAAALAPH